MAKKKKAKAKKTKFKSVPKSRKNTSGRKSKAASAGAKSKAAAKARLKGKKPKVAAKKPKKKKVSDPNLKAGYTTFKPKPLNAREARVLPESYATRKGLTLRKLLRNTPKLFVNNADFVDILDLKKVKTRTGMPALVGKLLTNDPLYAGHTKTPKSVHLIGLDKNELGKPDFDKPINKHRKVMIQCSCESYVFYGFEYSNAAHGAARIIYGNGEPPTVMNPQQAYGCCKHSYKLGLEAIRRNL